MGRLRLVVAVAVVLLVGAGFSRAGPLGSAGLIGVLGALPSATAEVQAGAQRSSRVPEVAHTRLENGLEIYVYEDPSAPLVSVNLWYRVGSRDEPVGRRGMAHLMEHMMFKGSARVAPEEHARIIQRVGGFSNAYTTTDATVYWDKVPSSQLELALALEAERMANLEITEEKLATEREVVKEEFRAALQNNPIGHALDRFHAWMFAGTPYAWTPGGAIEDLDQVSVEDLQEFYRRHYRPSNAVLVVAGDTRLEEVEALARRHFGPIEGGPAPPRPAVPFQAPRTADTAGSGQAQEHVMRLPIQLPGVIGGYAIPGASHPDQYPLGVATYILSGGRSSRLYQRLVREQQIAVVAAGVSYPYQQAGAFFIVAFFLPDRSPQAVLAALRQEVERLAEELPSPDELDRARNQLAAALAFQLDSLDGVANLIGQAVVIEGGLERFREGIEPYLTVTAEDVQRVARTYLRPENLTVVSVLPGPDGGS